MYARSVSASSEGKWMAMVKKHHAWKVNEPDVYLYGEDIYGVHSIEYEPVPEHETFRAFALRNGKGAFASFAEVEAYAKAREIPVVLVLFKGRFRSVAEIRTFVERAQREPSMLGGAREGVVLGLARGFPAQEFQNSSPLLATVPCSAGLWLARTENQNVTRVLAASCGSRVSVHYWRSSGVKGGDLDSTDEPVWNPSLISPSASSAARIFRSSISVFRLEEQSIRDKCSAVDLATPFTYAVQRIVACHDLRTVPAIRSKIASATSRSSRSRPAAPSRIILLPSWPGGTADLEDRSSGGLR